MTRSRPQADHGCSSLTHPVIAEREGGRPSVDSVMRVQPYARPQLNLGFRCSPRITGGNPTRSPLPHGTSSPQFPPASPAGVHFTRVIVLLGWERPRVVRHQRDRAPDGWIHLQSADAHAYGVAVANPSALGRRTLGPYPSRSSGPSRPNVRGHESRRPACTSASVRSCATGPPPRLPRLRRWRPRVPR
jgi:hypothetical protein